MTSFILLVPRAGGFLAPRQNKPHYVTTDKRRKAARVTAKSASMAKHKFKKRFPSKRFDEIFLVAPLAGA